PSATFRPPAGARPACAASKGADDSMPTPTTNAANNDFFSIFMALEIYSSTDAECSRRAVFAEEARLRAGERKRDRNVGRVERVADPELAEQLLAADAGAQVGER